MIVARHALGLGDALVFFGRLESGTLAELADDTALYAYGETAQDLFSVIFVYIHNMMFLQKLNCSTKVTNVIGLYQSFLKLMAGPSGVLFLRIA